jgi:hypothetical protein
MSINGWRIAWWSLFFVWILDAILVMSHMRAGVLTNYGADLTLPAWLYILTRSLDNPYRQTFLRRILGRTPELAAGAVFLASTLTEISQYFWPRGIFPGTFDLLDIMAYGVGIGICYVIDRRTNRDRA